MSLPAQIDHLVVLAATLDEGVAWCEATLSITPGPGGQHPLMGTINRLFSIASPAFPSAYFEIIAIDPQAPAPQRQRWFDMDDPALRARVEQTGPQLIHWVAGVGDARAAVTALRAQGLDRGEVISAARPTPQGLLQWQITVRADGQRLLDGCLPTLIQWGDTHPATAMPASGVTLESLALQHPQAPLLSAALASLGLGSVAVQAGSARLLARLRTSQGIIELSS